MTIPRLIGLTGLAGSGKDTVRLMLEAEHDFYGIAFADPIREMITALLLQHGFGTHWMNERSMKEAPIDGLGVSYRELAQTLGTQWGRALHPDLWLRVAQKSVADAGCRVVISDVRFPNEAEWIHSQGGEVWRIERPGIAPVREHESEQHVATLKADRVIVNNGTVEDLWKSIDSLMTCMKGAAT